MYIAKYAWNKSFTSQSWLVKIYLNSFYHVKLLRVFIFSSADSRMLAEIIATTRAIKVQVLCDCEDVV